MPRSAIGQLLVFVLIIVAANAILPMVGIPIHVSIVGSLVLTAILWIVMGLLQGKSWRDVKRMPDQTKLCS